MAASCSTPEEREFVEQVLGQKHAQLMADPDAVLLCPITHELFKDPVITSDGHTYERAAIQKHFDSNGQRSPLTNLMLDDGRLVENRVCKQAVELCVKSMRRGFVELIPWFVHRKEEEKASALVTQANKHGISTLDMVTQADCTHNLSAAVFLLTHHTLSTQNTKNAFDSLKIISQCELSSYAARQKAGKIAVLAGYERFIQDLSKARDAIAPITGEDWRTIHPCHTRFLEVLANASTDLGKLPPYPGK